MATVTVVHCQSAETSELTDTFAHFEVPDPGLRLKMGLQQQPPQRVFLRPSELQDVGI